ncbi:MAG: hypothetical protein HY909_05225 [Deltaproteobacteria bacterium]|nr:hypothetical protein [Deltaproteobacteria bacterium]
MKPAPAKAAAPKPEAPKVAAPSVRPSAPAEAPSAPPAAEPSSVEGGAAEGSAEGAAGAGVLRTKKKVKRGAPPMLPRRLVRRPPPSDGTPPPPPRPTSVGSLHTPARAPAEAEALKERLKKVMGDMNRLRALKRTLNKNFWEVGLLLQELSEPEMFRARGYGSWDAFVEREVEKDLFGRTLAQDLIRIVRVFQKERAEEFGLEKLRGALRALYPDPSGGLGAGGPPGEGGVVA